MGLNSGTRFAALRRPPAPTLYEELRTAVTEDVLGIGLIAAFAVLFLSFILSVPGAGEGKKQIVKIGKAFALCYVPLCILLSIFGFGWRAGSIETITAYRHFTNATIRAIVGVKFGLYSVNITLKGTPVEQLSEKIDYNENFKFGDVEGRLEFGEQGGSIRRAFRSGQFRGTPLPILWVAEYLTLDGEYLRWGRQYRQAGYFTAMLMWTAMGLWLLAVVTFVRKMLYTAYFSILSGLAHIAACLVYRCMHQQIGPAFEVPFEDAVLETKPAWGYYLALGNGIALATCGLLLEFFQFFCPDLLLVNRST